MSWKAIINGKYEIHPDGLVRNSKTKKVLKSYKDRDGYVRQPINNGGTKIYGMHRLLAEHFIDNPNPGKFNIVHHINNVRDDNSLDNLMWCDQKYNRSKAYVVCDCCGHKIKV